MSRTYDGASTHSARPALGGARPHSQKKPARAGGRAAREGRGIQSIEVGARLLQALVDDGGPMMLRDLAKRARIAPARAHAYLLSYRKCGLVEQDGQAGLYRVGPFALQLGIARKRGFDPLRVAADAVVDFSAETGLMVALTVWGAFGPTVIQVQEGKEQVHVTTRVGTIYSISGTATGRVFAAFLPESQIKQAVKAQQAESHFKQIGNHISYSLLKPELRVIRARGYATIPDPPVPGVNALAAPVFDHFGQLQIVVTLIGLAETLSMADDSPFIPVLLDFTGRLSAQFGYEPRL
jgi:DNA-binding IclR family transcriptional regulator